MKLLNYKLSALALLTLAVTVPQTRAQSIYNTPYTFTNFAGLPGAGAATVDGNGADARFNNPQGVAVDSTGNVYVADYGQTVRKITPAGDVTTLAGGTEGSADGLGAAAQFNYPAGVAVDTNGNVYVADQFNLTIRKITPAGAVTTLAGTAGVIGSADGNGAAAQFNYPRGVAVDTNGNVYVADFLNHTIRKIDTAANVTTLAGSPGVTGSADGTGSAAQFYRPQGVAVDSAGNVYVADFLNHTIRKIDTAGNVTTLAGLAGTPGSADGTGSAAGFSFPFDAALDSAGNVYVGDSGNRRITKGTMAPFTILSAARDYFVATVVSVVFDRPLVAATATNLSNYALNNSGTISGASLNSDGMTVVLTTSPLFNSVTHILTVNNVQGAGGMTIPTNSQITISVPSDTVRAEYDLGGTNSLLVLEAEHFNLNSAGGSSSWIFTAAPPLLNPTDTNTTFSGDGTMLADPNTGVNRGGFANGSVPTASPRLDFKVRFTTTGTFSVWVRGLGDSSPGPSADDSVFIGLDGAKTSGFNTFPLYQGFYWTGANFGDGGPIVISAPGLHVINVWMREDGFTVDKLLLTSDSGFVPTDSGPAESPVVEGPVIIVTRSGTDLILSWPGGGTLQSSTNVVGTYVDIPGSSSPFNVVPVGAQKYYRVRQ